VKTRVRMIAIALSAALAASGPLATAFAVEPWPTGSVRVAVDARRVAGGDRYATAVAIAREGFPGWADVSHVIIASGENRSLPDAVSAGGLVWAYDAPLLLVKGGAVPQSVRIALAEIRSANPTATVTVVGGSAAVSGACVNQLKSIVGAANVERPWTGAGRPDRERDRRGRLLRCSRPFCRFGEDRSARALRDEDQGPSGDAERAFCAGVF
jgi:hypothetical protein